MGYFSEIIRDSRSTPKPVGARPQPMLHGEGPDSLAAGEVQETSTGMQVDNTDDITGSSNEPIAPLAATPSGHENSERPLTVTQDTVREVNAGGVESNVEPGREESEVKLAEPNEAATFANEPLPVLDPPFRSQKMELSSSTPVSSDSRNEASFPTDSNPVFERQGEEASSSMPGKPELTGEWPGSHPSKPQSIDPANEEPASIEKPVPDSIPETGDEPPESRKSALPYSYKEASSESVKAEEVLFQNGQQVEPDSMRSEKVKSVRDPKTSVPEAPAYNYEQPMPRVDSFTPPSPRTEPARVPETNIRIGQIDIVVQAPQKAAKPQPTAPPSNWSSRLYLRRV
ncbi:hypothetical protein ACTRW9_02330 [Nitrospina sp. 32_T5]|uniref:hypothetical protein n=1 Tax=unclassified Nitrospina TaxID=2638683 RepID=UPI003F98A82E